jgi:hypothetical protein
VTYFVEDQFGTDQSPSIIAVAGIDVTELLDVLQQSHPSAFDPPEGTPRTVQTNVEGKINDNLSVTSPGGVPANFSATVDQQWTVTGFIFGQHQLISYGQTYATVSVSKVAR